MEIQSLRLEPDLSQQQQHQYITTTPNNIFQMISPRVKIDLSDSSSPVPGQWTDSNFLAAVYGYVGPSIVTFGLIGNLLILLVVGRSSMSGKLQAAYIYALQVLAVLLFIVPGASEARREEKRASSDDKLGLKIGEARPFHVLILCVIVFHRRNAGLSFGAGSV